MNHTLLPKEVLLPDWARRDKQGTNQESYKGWSCKTSYNFLAPKIFIFLLTFWLDNAMACSICRIIWTMLQRGRAEM